MNNSNNEYLWIRSIIGFTNYNIELKMETYWEIKVKLKNEEVNNFGVFHSYSIGRLLVFVSERGYSRNNYEKGQFVINHNYSENKYYL